jgi:hypothetical protein
MRELQDDEVVVQIGFVGVDGETFHNCPRAVRDDDALSVVLGLRSTADAVRAAFGREASPGYEVSRSSTVGRLRAKGFVVTHSPSRKNPNHASVTDPLAWTAARQAAFASCFN